MTGYTTHSGPNKKFQDGWQRVFGSGGKSTPSTKAGKAESKSKSDKKKGKG